MTNSTERTRFWQAPYWCPPADRGRIEQLEIMVQEAGQYADTLEWIKNTPRTGREAGRLHLHLWQLLNRKRF